MKKVIGGVTAAKGFLAAHTAAGIKYQDRNDMAMLYCKVSCDVAGTFTKNVVKAAPVLWDRDVCYGTKKAQAVVINAGIANACTGDEGMEYCHQTASAVKDAIGVEEKNVLVASTGVIGMQLPIEKIKAGVKAMAGKLSDSIEAGEAAAKAIMTTDTIKKETAVTIELPAENGEGMVSATIGGMSKGSGMIHPDMCTMLAFVTTDIAIDQGLLQEALGTVVEDTYNMISVDGDTSTNDTCVVLASGLAKNKKITEKNADYEAFVEALFEVNQTLAKMMAGDGEGATCLLEVKVENAKSVEDAKLLSKSVVSSSLTKAAVYGNDANWGRIMCALGYSGVEFDEHKVDVYFESENGRLLVAKNGLGTGFDEEKATEILKAEAVTILCDMHSGSAAATAWGCDLTHEYVSINADYRS